MNKCQKICGVGSILIFSSLFFFTLFGLDSLIEGVILDGVVLAPDTQGIWGENPGATNTLTLRNFTFYNLTNPREFLYRGEKPKFNEMSNYLLQERSNFTNIVYSEDNSYIDYNYWLYFSNLEESRDLEEIVTVLNLAPIGFWSQLENIDLSALAIQGFGGLFVEMNNTIKSQAIGQGVAGQYLANYSTFSSLCKMLQIEQKLCERLYDDPLYGLGDPNNYEIWVDWSYYNNKDAQFVLYEYFSLKRIQLQAFDKVFEKWCFSIDSILDNWYCRGPCSNYDLTILQLSSSGVTRNPPTGDAADSICLTPKATLTQNISCQGFPELYSFHKYWFPKINNGSEFKGLSFSIQTVKQLYTPYKGTLLNVGNLSHLFEVGTAYDQQQSAENLQKLTKYTHAETSKHAIVIWEYVKYFSYEFVLQAKDKGTKKIAGLGGVFSQALYESFTQFSDWIHGELLSILVAEKIPNCTQFLSIIIDDIAEGRAKQLCNNVNAENYQNYYRLIEPCHNEYLIDDYQRRTNFNGYEIGELCNVNQTSMLEIINEAHQFLHTQYECISAENRCTKFELAAKQFINSSITSRPLTSTIKQHPSSLSGREWNSNLQQWEYRHFLNVVYGNSSFDKSKYQNYSRIIDLLSFDKLFSGPMIQNMTLVENATFFEELFYSTNKTLMLEYIRFVTIEIGFGGFTQKRTVNELLFGYEDEFLKNLKEMDTMLGGDPSIETTVALNEPNSTLDDAYRSPQSMYTGYSDPMITRNYKSNLGQEIITYNKTYYDGYQVISESISPFKDPVKLFGTDGIQEKPLSNPNDNQYIYIDSLYRIGELAFDKYVDRYGFEAMRYVIADRMIASSQEYPPNENYYQGIKGFMNLSFMGLPLFASKNHFLGSEEKWENLIQTYDESGKYPQFANEFDETEVITEPKSGATFVATLYLQTSVYLNQDILFTQQSRMLPVFTLYRSGNMTEDSANDLLGDLKIALQAPRKLVLLSLFGIIFTIFLMIACSMRSKSSEHSSSLLSSTHEEMRVEEIQQQ